MSCSGEAPSVSKALPIFAQAPLFLIPKIVPSEGVLKTSGDKWRRSWSAEVDQVSWGLKLVLEGILSRKTNTHLHVPSAEPWGVSASLVALTSWEMGSSGLRLRLGTVAAESQGSCCWHGSEVLPGCSSARTADSGVRRAWGLVRVSCLTGCATCSRSFHLSAPQVPLLK